MEPNLKHLTHKWQSTERYTHAYNAIQDAWRMDLIPPWVDATAIHSFMSLPYEFQALVVYIAAEIIASQSVGFGWENVPDAWDRAKLYVQSDRHMQSLALRWVSYVMKVDVDRFLHEQESLGIYLDAGEVEILRLISQTKN